MTAFLNLLIPRSSLLSKGQVHHLVTSNTLAGEVQPPEPRRAERPEPALLWMLAGLAAAVLGATAPEPGRRGLLVLPFMLGALVLVVWVAEAIIPH